MSEDKVRPIRPGVEPKTDVERELIEWATVRIREFVANNGEPTSIAIVLANREVFGANSWSVGPDGPTRAECCGQAAAILLRRAAGE